MTKSLCNVRRNPHGPARMTGNHMRWICETPSGVVYCETRECARDVARGYNRDRRELLREGVRHMIYLRKEWTTDKMTLDQPASLSSAQRDVVAYDSDCCTKAIARWPWQYSGKPDRRYKRVMFNCHTHNVQWLKDQ